MPSSVNREIMPDIYEENSIVAFHNTTHLYQPNTYCFGPHWHDWMEILYVFYGSLQVQVNQEHFIVSQGECALFFPGQLHFGNATDTGARYSILLFDPPAFYNHTRSSKKLLRPMFDLKDGYINRTSHPDVLEAFHEVLNCYSGSSKLTAHPLVLVGQLYKLLAAIQSNCLAINHKSNQTHPGIITVMEYINEHFKEPLSTETMSNLLGYEDSYFIRLFKKNVGMTPRVYIRSIRLDKAQKMLSSTDEPISVIARDCGFENASYFTRAFQEVYHTTPSAYRNESQSKASPHEAPIYL